MTGAADIVVIGGGLAGLTAANRAASLGLKSLVLEQGTAADYACNSRYSGGLFHVAFKDVAGPADAVLAAVEAEAPAEPALARRAVLAAEAPRALDWLKGEGVRFIRGGPLEFMRWVLAPPRPRTAGLDWKGRGPDVLLRRLTENLSKQGGTLRLGCRAVEAIMEEGRVAGFVVEGPAGREDLRAPAVVIADGGFQSNMDLMARYVSPKPESLLQRGGATGMGDGMLLAEAAGAKLIGMESFYGHLLGREAFQIEKLWPYPVVDSIARVAILVGPDGKRFTDEGKGGVAMANAVAKLADPLSTTVVFDDAVWNGIAADNRYPPCMNPTFVNAGGTVLEAGDIAGLANAAGVDADGLAATVAAYNAAIAGGPALDPARSALRFKPEPILKPPFRAIQLAAGITYTMGGVAIDAASRVERADGGVLPGLYAAGSASGGMEGGADAAYLGGLAKAVVTGLKAAESAAEDIGKG